MKYRVPLFLGLCIFSDKLESLEGKECIEYSKTCLKRPLKNRQNKCLNDKW